MIAEFIWNLFREPNHNSRPSDNKAFPWPGYSLPKIKRPMLPQKHLWQETERCYLGQYQYYDCDPHSMERVRVYRIAIHETCILTGVKRIREIKVRGYDRAQSMITEKIPCYR